MVVYILINKYNGRVYVGFTSNYEVRKYTHFHALKSGTHCNLELQNDFDLGHYFAWQIVATNISTKKEGLKIEKNTITDYPNCYNINNVEETIPVTLYLLPSEAEQIGTGGKLDMEILQTVKQKLEVKMRYINAEKTNISK